MKQIRNMTMSMIAQSALHDRVAETESRQVRMHKTTISLEEIDKQIRHEASLANKELSVRFLKYTADQKAVQDNNTDRMNTLNTRIGRNKADIDKHKEMLDENKHMLSAN